MYRACQCKSPKDCLDTSHDVPLLQLWDESREEVQAILYNWDYPNRGFPEYFVTIDYIHNINHRAYMSPRDRPLRKLSCECLHQHTEREGVFKVYNNHFWEWNNLKLGIKSASASEFGLQFKRHGRELGFDNTTF
jgi:hypothetical protein